MNYEDRLKEVILPELDAGRPNWDKPHTEAVVFYVKTIIAHSSELNLDKDVLVIAAHAHDWGYVGLFKDGKVAELDDVKKAKTLHMVIGARKLSNLLREPTFDFLSQQRKERAIHLVSVHDQLEKLTESDELVLAEADTLAGLDAKRVTPSYSKESNSRYMESVVKNRRPLFITRFGKEIFDELFNYRKAYYETSKQ